MNEWRGNRQFERSDQPPEYPGDGSEIRPVSLVDVNEDFRTGRTAVAPVICYLPHLGPDIVGNFWFGHCKAPIYADSRYGFLYASVSRFYLLPYTYPLLKHAFRGLLVGDVG